jgi:hypothetical protein
MPIDGLVLKMCFLISNEPILLCAAIMKYIKSNLYRGLDLSLHLFECSFPPGRDIQVNIIGKYFLGQGIYLIFNLLTLKPFIFYP